MDFSGDRAGQATMRLIRKDRLGKTEPQAAVGGINIHAAVAFDARDRPRMERMVRDWAGPPVAQQLPTQRCDGSIQSAMKKACRGGTHTVVLSPLDLIARLCAMIPPPNSVAHRGPTLKEHVRHA